MKQNKSAVENEINFEKIAARANLLTCSMSHGAAVECAIEEAGESFDEIGEIVSTMLTNFEINGQF